MHFTFIPILALMTTSFTILLFNNPIWDLYTKHLKLDIKYNMSSVLHPCSSKFCPRPTKIYFSGNLGLLFEVIFLFSQMNIPVISIILTAFQNPSDDLSHRDSKETYFRRLRLLPPSSSVRLSPTSKDVQMIMSKSYSIILYSGL